MYGINLYLTFAEVVCFMKLLSSAVFACLLLATGALSQTPSPTPISGDDGDIVRISTSLIQVDVTVLDKKGNQVTDLRPEDFEVRENGKIQNVTNFSYISVAGETVGPSAAGKQAFSSRTASRIPPIPLKLRPEQVRRTIVLVVDDLGLSFAGTFWVRDALMTFVDRQMQPDDLVAIVRTGSSVGALQQFTSDKRLLYAAISKIKWSMISRRGLWNFEPIRPTTKDLINGTVSADGGQKSSQGNEKDKENEKKAGQFREEVYTVGTLGSLRQIIAGLDPLPGRKGIILFSEGIKMDLDIEPQMRKIVDLANRAGVVINSVDAKGLDDAGFMGPENDTRGMTFEQIDAAENERRTDFIKQTEGLSYLTYGTGGRPIQNTNDLGDGIARILRNENGYYLLAYEPDEAIFDPKAAKFNRLEIKVNRPDVSVRYRSGFFGISDKDIKAAGVSTKQQLSTALLSPFAAKDIETKLTSVFATDPAIGGYTRALLHIDTKAIEKTDEPGDNKKISLDIYAYVFGPDGTPVKELKKNFEFGVKNSSLDRLNEKGIIFPMNVPIEKPGAYQLRMAVRDTRSGKIGSASQFIEIPDLKKNTLTLSGIVVQNTTNAQLKAGRLGDANSSLFDTATRTFKRGSILIYNYAIYNARSAKGSSTPQLTAYARLFRDGKLIFESAPAPVNTTGQGDPGHIEDRGILTLGSDLAPGDYVLQIVATDALAKEKYQIAAQSIDFEVIQ